MNLVPVTDEQHVEDEPTKGTDATGILLSHTGTPSSVASTGYSGRLSVQSQFVQGTPLCTEMPEKR